MAQPASGVRKADQRSAQLRKATPLQKSCTSTDQLHADTGKRAGKEHDGKPACSVSPSRSHGFIAPLKCSNLPLRLQVMTKGETWPFLERFLPRIRKPLRSNPTFRRSATSRADIVSRPKLLQFQSSLSSMKSPFRANNHGGWDMPPTQSGLLDCRYRSSQSSILPVMFCLRQAGASMTMTPRFAMHDLGLKYAKPCSRSASKSM
mmetsp:Transcript_105533/g.283738  ORF Transcript_105533/g.283738 Transcript_105533/m.283738 type:complete len:205 (+) Transcript_105533:685-1299(+)